MQLLYPCDPFDKKTPDQDYADEHAAALAAGLSCSLFSFEDFQLGAFLPRSALVPGADVLYRGWMLTPARYAQLVDAIASKGAQAMVSAGHYRSCHHLPGWYERCRDLTPATIVLSEQDDIAEALARTGWSAFFVKDFVKSLTTSRGSVARDANEVREVLDLIARYRGELEGGICIRELESLVPDSEARYFVLRGKAYAREGDAPALVHEIARRIDSPFFSVDVALGANGELRLIEIGDGQVSDRKQWPAARLIEMLCA
jgi:hypothetical protein